MYRLFIAFLLLPLLGLAQKNTKPAPAKPAAAGQQVRLVCKIYDFPKAVDSISLFEITGMGMRPIQRAAYSPDSTFVFVLPKGPARLYGVGIPKSDMTGRVILGEEPEVKFYAYAYNMHRGRTTGSAQNKAYEDVRKQLDIFQKAEAFNRQTAVSNGEKAEAYAIKLNDAQKKYLDSLRRTQPMLAKLAGLRLMPQFRADQRGKSSEYFFLGEYYFENADLKDPAYESIPEVYDAFADYANKLVTLRVGGNRVVELADAQLAKIPAGSNTYRMALGGLVKGFKDVDNSAWLVMLQRYLDKYRKKDMGEIAALAMDLERAATNVPGLAPPNLEGMTPDSTRFSLASLRGKVVMLDFWASWCAPCRRENPNVKRLYEKYKDKGFDILGVSLDRDAPSWKRAIETDGLTWHHISDLGGWQSRHAQLYGVTSIPQTLLLDKEGKLIQRNLQGPALEAKLKEIFGE